MGLPKGYNRRKTVNRTVTVIELFARKSSFCTLIVPYNMSMIDSYGHERGCGSPLIIIMWVALYSQVMLVMQD